MSVLSLKSNEKDFSEISLRAWCVSLVTERFNGLVLETRQTKLKGLMSMEWTHFFVERIYTCFSWVNVPVLNVAFPGSKFWNRDWVACEKCFYYWVLLGSTSVEILGWGSSWAVRLNVSSEFTWNSTRGLVFYISYSRPGTNRFSNKLYFFLFVCFCCFYF